jgi:hypothetical protein|tara:strand:+ start:115 stop:576 length:462 start_codon:yes stop_codon:yes gene_type:complete
MDADKEIFALAGWITSVILGVTGLGFSSLGWFVRGRQARQLAVQKDIHDAVDRAVKALADYEDAVYEFWSDQASKVRLDQLITLHSRCIWHLRQLNNLRAFDMPNPDLGDMRRYATLDAETAVRPEPKPGRLRKFSRATAKILNSEFLKKSWK